MPTASSTGTPTISANAKHFGTANGLQTEAFVLEFPLDYLISR